MATTLELKPEADTLTNEEILRYSRHLIMPEVGMEGQLKLKSARVLCIGAGGLGSPLALYLGAAGVGTLGIVDFDVVDYTNLQRQIIHSTADVGRKKLDSAAEKLKAINPLLNIRKFDTRLSSSNALELFREFDIIADGTDNFPTRYLVNDACVLTGKPNVYGSIFRFEGQASVFATKEGPCYRCLYPEPPGNFAWPSRRDAGDGGHQAHPGQRRVLDWPLAADRCLGYEVPRTQAAQKSQLPSMRNSSDRHGADRL